jgi:predicted ArsR family transcriptional regulator
MTTAVTDDHERRVHRALASPVRARLLDALRAEPDADTAAIAERLGLHVNTVRVHLGVLEDAGLVAATTDARRRVGRPRRLYRAVDGDAAPAPPASDRGYGFLARVLAGELDATGEDATTAGERAGAAWGARLVDRPEPSTAVDAAGAIDQVVGLLDHHGFAPAVQDDGDGRVQVRLRRCPFLDVAREHEDLVCSLHLGLMRGALQALGNEVVAERLVPWAEPGACLATLAVGRPTVPPSPGR